MFLSVGPDQSFYLEVVDESEYRMKQLAEAA